MISLTRKKIISAFLIYVFVFCFLIFGLTNGAAPEELKNSIDLKTRELQEINDKIKKSQQDIETTQEEKKSLQKEIKKIDSTVNQLNLNIHSGEIIVDKLGLEIRSLQYDIDDAKIEINEKKKIIVKILRELQEKDGETPFIILLKNKSLTESIFEIQNLADFNGDLAVKIKELENIRNGMTEKAEESSVKKQKIEIENENLKNRKTIIVEQKNDKNNFLKITKNKESLYQKQLAELEKQQEAIGKEIEEMEDQLRISFDPSLLPAKRPGVLGSPVASGNGQNYVTQEYGATKFAQRAYKTKFHNGVDFRAPIGTPITAVEDGKVRAVGNNGRIQYGRYIVIEHPNNLSSLYAHLSSQTVKNGETVKRGQIIGYSGNSGYAFGAHLHFTVYWAPSVEFKSIGNAGLVPIGTTINPIDYLEL